MTHDTLFLGLVMGLCITFGIFTGFVVGHHTGRFKGMREARKDHRCIPAGWMLMPIPPELKVMECKGGGSLTITTGT